jgi:hypothetical protein
MRFYNTGKPELESSNREGAKVAKDKKGFGHKT